MLVYAHRNVHESFVLGADDDMSFACAGGKQVLAMDDSPSDWSNGCTVGKNTSLDSSVQEATR